FSLTGSATSLGELCEWDGGGVRTSHQEFGGRVTQMDSPGGTHYHSTHVAGTLIGAGVVSSAKGMSYQGTLAAYEWTNDDSEMASAAAAGMNVSNHSYGYGTGWSYSSSSGDWYWYGDVNISAVEDYGFGFYSVEAEAWDQIAYDAPYYTICKSAGNDRNDYPGAGAGHYYWDDGSGWTWSTATRDPDGGTDGYDCISWNGTAKNILSVGAVNDIPGGWTQPSDVVMSSFSGWGPTDDGRIKPDLCANGISLYSSMDGNDTDYYSLSGTSMSSPNLAGSLNLLIRHFEATHVGATPLASTMKAVLIQTADEAGPDPGPDYMFGWGLMNTLGAAELIQDDSTTPGYIHEESLANGATDEYYIASDGLEPIRVSLAWTDPPGTPPSPSLNPTTSNLVNDLDLRIERVATSTVYEPYVLNPSSPSSAATTGDNYRDNSEQVYIESPASGQYLVSVTHKGTLLSNQDYSLVLSLLPGTTDTEDPVVTVNQPNGGENWAVDSFFDIMWTATDNIGVTSIDILLSSDGGATYPHTIAMGEANDGIFNWPVDGAPTTQARVKVIAHDAAANVGADESDADFEIADGEAPLVTVIQPNGGENWAVDSFFDIMWTATDNIGVTSIDILLSSDGGATFPTTIATGEANDGIFNWLVDVAPTTQARVKVIAHDAAANVGEDISDADFTIYDGEGPLVTVIQPNGGENWAVDSFFDIMWTATDNIGVTSIDILLSSDGGATYPHTIAMGEANDGIFNWLVDGASTTQARVKVIAHDAAANVGEDDSDADFEITDGEAPLVTVIQPNGGEVWDIDSFFDIMWTATDNIGVTSIDILLSSDGGATYPYTIATGEANDGTYPWHITQSATTTARIKVVAYDAGANSGEDMSDADFELYDPASGVDITGDVPLSAVITGNSPNPFAETTEIRFGIPVDGHARLAVYDVSGREVDLLLDRVLPAGYHSVNWRNSDKLSMGLYFVKLRTGAEEVTHKAVLSR
ncbi:MAG: S8 family serine peptidase, partial [Candidatus Eisenbacteria bacterium]